jgi:hypothetical protein
VAAALTPPGVHPATAAAAAKRVTQESQQQQQQQQHLGSPASSSHHLVHLSLQSSLLIVVVLLQLYILLHGRLGSLCSGAPAHHLQWCAPALEQQTAELQDLQL